MTRLDWFMIGAKQHLRAASVHLEGRTMPVISSAHRAHMDSILILDFGSQYTQLIARQVRSSTPCRNQAVERRLAHPSGHGAGRRSPRPELRGSFCPAAPTACGRPMRPPDLEGARQMACPRRLLRRPVARPEWRRQCSGQRQPGIRPGPFDSHRHQRSPVFRHDRGQGGLDEPRRHNPECGQPPASPAARRT